MLQQAVLALGIVHLGLCIPLAKRMIDITQPFDNNTIYYPSIKKFQMNVTFKGYLTTPNNKSLWTTFEEYSSGIHVGTHMDAPLDFYEHGWTLDQIPISRFIAPAAVVDIVEKAERNRDYEVTVDDLLQWEAATGQTLNEVVLLMRSGWSKKYHDRELYTGTSAIGQGDVLGTFDLHSPGLSPDAAKWLVDNRNIYGVGSETLSLDYGPSVDFAAHVILFKSNIFGLENVGNIEELPLYGATLYAMPSKFIGTSGAPVRLIATFPVVVLGKGPCRHSDHCDL